MFNITNDNNLLVSSKISFRVPFAGAINLTATLDVDHDTEPATGVDSTDRKYLLSLGYAW